MHFQHNSVQSRHAGERDVAEAVAPLPAPPPTGPPWSSSPPLQWITVEGACQGRTCCTPAQDRALSLHASVPVAQLCFGPDPSNAERSHPLSASGLTGSRDGLARQQGDPPTPPATTPQTGVRGVGLSKEGLGQGSPHRLALGPPQRGTRDGEAPPEGKHPDGGGEAGSPGSSPGKQVRPPPQECRAAPDSSFRPDRESPPLGTRSAPLPLRALRRGQGRSPACQSSLGTGGRRLLALPSQASGQAPPPLPSAPHVAPRPALAPLRPLCGFTPQQAPSPPAPWPPAAPASTPAPPPPSAPGPSRLAPLLPRTSGSITFPPCFSFSDQGGQSAPSPAPFQALPPPPAPPAPAQPPTFLQWSRLCGLTLASVLFPLLPPPPDGLLMPAGREQVAVCPPRSGAVLEANWPRPPDPSAGGPGGGGC